jgi:hypothetical protein
MAILSDNDRISLPSHENADLRSGLPLLGVVPGPVLGPELNGRGRKFFHLFDYQPTTTVLLAVYHRLTTVCLSLGGVLCTFDLSSYRRHTAVLSSPHVIRQLLCFLTPHRLGGTIGHPRHLVTHVPSFPPAKQHHARHAESES